MKATTKLRHSFSLNWIDTLDPDCYWTHPHGLERMILAFQFLVRTGAAISHPYGTSGPLDLLSKKPSCVNFSRVDPILSLDDLRSRFHWVLLCRMECAAVAKWKDANGIALDGMSRIPGRHFPPMNP
ncbi:MAG: hypothetical protein NT069_29205, partial [Planctomycetota bacterium]|nr:hypothetical protein [Planctomycetota bacterium]